MESSENNSDNPFGDWLLGQIQLRGWTKAKLSKIANVTDSQVSGHILGTKKPGDVTIFRYSTALGIPIEEIKKHVSDSYKNRYKYNRTKIKLSYLWSLLTSKERQIVNSIIEDLIKEREEC